MRVIAAAIIFSSSGVAFGSFFLGCSVICAVSFIFFIILGASIAELYFLAISICSLTVVSRLLMSTIIHPFLQSE